MNRNSWQTHQKNCTVSGQSSNGVTTVTTQQPQLPKIVQNAGPPPTKSIILTTVQQTTTGGGQQVWSIKQYALLGNYYTASDLFSGHGYSGNDGFSGTKPLDDAILFTNSGITALVELFLEKFDVCSKQSRDFTKMPKPFFFKQSKKVL